MALRQRLSLEGDAAIEGPKRGPAALARDQTGRQEQDVVQSPTVLFVDDEPDFVRALVKRMQKRNVNALGASSGEEAVEVVS